MPKIVAVLWDLDDTLINTTVTRLRAQRSMVETILTSLPSASSLTTDQVVEKVERLVQLFGSTYYVQHISLMCRELVPDPVACQHLVNLGCQAYREVFWQIEPVEGAPETLRTLKERGYRPGVVSNGLYPLQMQKLMWAGLEQYFDRQMIFVSSHYQRQFEVPPTHNEYSGEDLVNPVELETAWLKDRVEKPWPHMFTLALSACNCSADQVIYAGNRITDFVSAKLLGIWSVKVNAHGTAEPPGLLAIEEPDFTIDGVPEIFSIISQIETR